MMVAIDSDFELVGVRRLDMHLALCWAHGCPLASVAEMTGMIFIPVFRDVFVQLSRQSQQLEDCTTAKTCHR
jgi:hypothetical protein